MSTTLPDLEAGCKQEPDSPTPSRTSTLHRVLSPGQQNRVRGEVPLELVGAILEKGDAFVVRFENEQDPRNPQNWPLRKKVMQNALITAATLWAGVGSAILSGANPNIQEHFGVSSVVAELANGMFVLGFALGPQVFGPLSEVLGRKWPLALGLFLGTMFSIQTAGASNLATVMLGRFFGGVFGAAPYAIGGGWFHDVYDAMHVQAGVAFFAVATAGGPSLGPILGAGLASTSSTYGWRWTEWFMTAFGALITLLLVVFMDESYALAILKREALKMRRQTGNWAWHAELDTVVLSPKDILLRYVLRPIKMLLTEPMLLVITIYMSFVYALLYMLMSAVPIIFGEMRGMGPVVSTLPFVSIFIGILAGGGIIILDMKRYARALERSNRTEDGDPEQRFIPMGLGAVLLPIGLLWFAFTGPAQTASPWPSIIALSVSMCGMVIIFECGIIYLIDMYRSFANSAIAANTVFRSILGGSFPLFTSGMVHNLGYQSTWAMFLLACLALLLAPIPFVFFRTGARLRAMSKFSLEL